MMTHLVDLLTHLFYGGLFRCYFGIYKEDFFS